MNFFSKYKPDDSIMNPKLNQQKRIDTFMESTNTLCDSAYGEFFTMISRIYHSLNNFFLNDSAVLEACF